MELDRLSYVLARNKYLELHCSDGEVFLLEDSVERISRAHPDVFLKIHRNCAVGKAYVNSIRVDCVETGAISVIVGPKDEPLRVSRNHRFLVKFWAKSNGKPIVVERISA